MSGAELRSLAARKVFAALDADQRRAAVGLFLLMVVGMALAQLNGFVAVQPKGMVAFGGERAERLFGGQRIGVARALDHYPALLVLDEVTNALDVATEVVAMEVLGALRGRKIIVIAILRFARAEPCDWLCRLESSRVVQTGSPAEVLDQFARTADAAVPSLE